MTRWAIFPCGRRRCAGTERGAGSGSAATRWSVNRSWSAPEAVGAGWSAALGSWEVAAVFAPPEAPTAPGTCWTRPPTPPLGARPDHVPRPQAAVPYNPGDHLVLYTDGLIERRHQDIDAGLRQITDALARHAGMNPDRLADAVLARLGVAGGARDDTALITVRL